MLARDFDELLDHVYRHVVLLIVMGKGGWDRTNNLRNQSPLLCRLSYAPMGWTCGRESHPPGPVLQTGAWMLCHRTRSWSRVWDSNPRGIAPPAYKAGAVAAEPTRHKWSYGVESNLRPAD